jgi:hypothetical protein
MEIGRGSRLFGHHIYEHVFRQANFTAAIHTNDPDHNIIRSSCGALPRKLNNNASRKEGIVLLDRIFERVQRHSTVLFMNDKHDNYITTMAADGNFFECNQSISFVVLPILLHSQFFEISTLDKDHCGKMSSTFDQMFAVISFVSIKDHNPGLVIGIFEEPIARIADGAIT